jgi:hypothetical protein
MVIICTYVYTRCLYTRIAVCMAKCKPSLYLGTVGPKQCRGACFLEFQSALVEGKFNAHELLHDDLTTYMTLVHLAL